MYEKDKPLITTNQNLPEITLKGIFIAIFITILLTASNAYLALKVGTTIAASIPAAVMAMGLLRCFKSHNVLETNIIQTAASAGEALVAAIAYTIPALVMMHYWNSFHYWQIVIIAILGGIMGVLFSVPLRRVLLKDKTLHFPEGTAIGNVLIASASAKTGLKRLLAGGLVGGLISFCQTGLQIFTDHWDIWWGKAATTVYGFGLGFSPALIAAGYIIGIRVSIALFVGVLLVWLGGIPILSHVVHAPIHLSASGAAMWLWIHEGRYIGVGTMLVGGIWLLFAMMKPIFIGISKSIIAVKQTRTSGHDSIPRIERDIPINYAMAVVLILMVPIYIYLFANIEPTLLGISLTMHIVVALVLMLFVALLGFFISSICGYFAGLIGSTNSPLSGMILISLISGAFLIMLMFVDQQLGAKQLLHLAALTVMVVAIIGSAGAIGIDTMQDLKAGHMVGATPWKQQVMLILGVILSALIAPLILNLLFNAYGIGNVLPRPGMDPAQALSAPQGQLIQAVVMGVFGHNLNWPMIYVGMAIAAVCIIIDEFLKPRSYRLPVLAVGLGIYLPIEVTVPVIVGGVMAYLADTKFKKMTAEKAHNNNEQATLLACGIVAGASLMGVLLAIPFVIYQSSQALAIMPANLGWLAAILGGLSAIYIAVWLYRTATKN